MLIVAELAWLRGEEGLSRSPARVERVETP